MRATRTGVESFREAMPPQVRKQRLELLEGEDRSPENGLHRGVLGQDELGEPVRVPHATGEGNVVAVDADHQIAGAIWAHQTGEGLAPFGRQALGEPEHEALLPNRPHLPTHRPATRRSRQGPCHSRAQRLLHPDTEPTCTPVRSYDPLAPGRPRPIEVGLPWRPQRTYPICSRDPVRGSAPEMTTRRS